MDAFCIHMGANLGVGGTVVGDCLTVCSSQSNSFGSDCADVIFNGLTLKTL